MRADRSAGVSLGGSLTLMVLLLGACGNGRGATTSDAATRLDAPDCAEGVTSKWNRFARIDSGVVSSATVGGGALTMTVSRAPAEPCQPDRNPVCPSGLIELAQGGLADEDFDATATFEAFAPGGSGSAAGLRVMSAGSNQPVSAFIRQSDTPVLEIFVWNQPMVSLPIAGTSGTFRVVRRAGAFTVTASSGTDSIEVVDPVSWTGQILVGVGIYNRGDTVIDGETSIRFTDFQVHGNTRLQSDTFDCN